MAVPEDLVEEFLLRRSPTDPASLVRSALVCKPWCRLISSARFRRRFREFHRTPPKLGFLATSTNMGTLFVSTSSFRPLGLAEYSGWLVLDAHHGRVLLRRTDMDFEIPGLVVWVPVTNEFQKLPLLYLSTACWNAAVLCAACGSCDHLDCQHGGPFLVVLVATFWAQSTLSVYSSESCSWSDPKPLPSSYVIDKVAPSALVGTTVYFMVDRGWRILGYDLATEETLAFSLPPGSAGCDPVLTTTEDGGLGVASSEVTLVERPLRGGKTVRVRLSLWSMETRPDGDIRWAQMRVIELEKLLHVMASSIYPTPVGFAPGLIFFMTVDGLFSINLISDQVKKEVGIDKIWVTKVVPYMSFYSPAPGLSITDEGPALGASGT